MADFDWNGEEDRACVVFPSVRGVAVYENEAGDVVLLQEARPHDNEDVAIVVPRAQVEVLAARLLDLVKA